MKRLLRLTPFQSAANTARIVAVLSLTAFFSLPAAADTATVTGTTVEFYDATTNWMDGTELVLVFENGGSFILPGKAKARILAVGGGGGGAGVCSASAAMSTYFGAGGGGGAGGFVEMSGILDAMTYSVAVGGGGAGGASANAHAAGRYSGKDGGDTTVTTNGVAMIRAVGGGGGGGEAVGRSGGSGGGGSFYRSGASAGQTRAGGAAVEGLPPGIQGHAGGAGDKGLYGGGGGGAGEAGDPASTLNPVGGDGRASNITGKEEWYAGGGGGGFCDKSFTGLHDHIAGGKGGGGSGGYGLNVRATNATGYGGGGGGCGAVPNASTIPGGSGHSGVVIVRIIVATSGDIVKPTNETVTFDGNEHVLVPANPAYEIVDKTEGSPTYGDVVDHVSGTTAGTYKAEVTLVEGFKWSDGTDTSPVNVTLTINKATPVITNLKIRDWIYGTPAEQTPKPSCEVSIAVEAKYKYGDSSAGPWGADNPTAAGTHWVLAYIEETESYNAAVSAPVSFSILDGPGDVFRDYVEITIEGAVPADFIYELTLSEAKPIGFLYSRAGPTGEDMAITDEGGALLDYKVDDWLTNGTSRIFVKLPELPSSGGKIRLFWCVRDGKTAPGHSSSIGGPSGDPQPGCTFDLVVRDGKRVNYWLSYPDLTSYMWDSADTPGTVKTYGTLAEGSSALLYVTNLNTGAVYSGITTDGGYFSAVFGPHDPAGDYEPLEYAVDYFVVGHVTYDDLAGDAGGVTQNGRVLLANDVANTGGDAGYAVTDQSHWQTDSSAYSTYWAHTDAHNVDVSKFPHILSCFNHTLYTKDANGNAVELWRLENVLIGNLYKADLTLDSNICALPYSPNSKPISSPTASSGLGEAGNLVMRNDTSAKIISPSYTNGIGTIYFDVVNGNRNYVDSGYKIVVKVSTDGGATWTPKTMYPFKTEGGSAFTAAAGPTGTEELTLAITSGGRDDSFYRVCVPVNVDGNVRFRIERTAQVPNATWDVDENGFILVDNIIVSYPKSTATLEPYGEFDSTRHGRHVLGWAGAMSEPFPYVGGNEIYARAKAIVHTNTLSHVSVDMPISWAQMHYRWRYLDQKTNEWKVANLRPMADFVSMRPLEFPQAEGDVEFWYDYVIQVPAYKYHDYSGADLDLAGTDGKPVYSEDVTKGTNTQVKTTGYPNLPSGGDDWFFRLRRGESEWESFVLYAKEGPDGVERAYDMFLSADHVWRGLCPTYNEVEDGLYIRVMARNAQTPGGEEYELNATRFALAGDADALPTTGTMVECADAESWPWRKVPCDGRTGRVMLQLQDDTLAYTVVHADYQDFNGWTDANKPDKAKGLFTGTSSDTNDTHMSGTTAKAVTHTTHFEEWNETIATNANWSEYFTTTSGEWPLYKPFSKTVSPNGLSVGPGQWVNGWYRDSNTGMALQMEGNGKGFIQLVDFVSAPRGIESLQFRGRVAQAITFNDFCYYMGTDITALRNYTFVSRAAFDLSGRTAFAGNASLSLVAYYFPGIGCYELRVEQDNATISAGTGDVTGPGNRFRISLYKWTYSSISGNIMPTLIGSVNEQNGTNPNGMFGTTAKSTDPSGEATDITYGGLFISADSTTEPNTTRIVAGVARTSVKSSDFFKSGSFRVLYYKDTSDDRLTAGTYGALSANCPGRFVSPSHCDAVVAYSGAATFHSATPSFTPPGTRTSCAAQLEDNKWMIKQNRMMAERVDKELWCRLVAKTPETTVDVYTAPAGSDNWKKYDSYPVSGFGTSKSAGDVTSVNIYSLSNCSVRVQAGGDENTARVDVTLDDLVFRQWRGESYTDKGQAGVVDTYQGAPTNIVFTQSWISNRMVSASETAKACLLSAKRSLPDVVTSIRSPRMVDDYGKGLGLGMLKFTYENAQSNAVLLVQIATNSVALSTFDTITTSMSPSLWTTVTNVDFSAMTPKDRASGTLSFYFGLHGVPGAMRLALDPASAAAVANVTDPTAFGEVLVTGISFRDEPMLDKYSWWGWNLRTTDEADKRSLADNAFDGLDNGLSFGLNNSVTEDVRKDEPQEQFKKKYPFLQTPTFATNLVNEVSFLARLYDPAAGTARVTLYGADSGDLTDEGSWRKVRSWDVTNTTYEAYSERISAGSTYKAFRLAVTGVDGVEERMPDDDPLVPAQRVLLDEVLVMEGIVPKVGFANVAAFRTGLDESTAVTNIMSVDQQPLCKEEWGVQCEIYASQLAGEIKLDNARVRLWWYEDEEPWGFERWKNRPGAQRAWLERASDSNLVFRSGYFTAPGAVMPAQQSYKLVQWTLEVEYEAGGAWQTNWLTSAEWSTPEWYAPLDCNADRGNGAFSAYTILDTVAPRWAWINEVNVFGEYDEDFNNSDRPLQFVEIAAPADADLTGWRVRFLDAKVSGSGGTPRLTRVVTNDVAVFGPGGPPGTKTGLKHMDEESKFVFHVVGSPYALGVLDSSDGRLDGLWAFSQTTDINRGGGELETYYPMSIQLVRPSGVVEHSVTTIGTNEVSYISSYNPEFAAELLKAAERGGRTFYAGADEGGLPAVSLNGWSRSLGVFCSHGETFMQWGCTNVMTPGEKNVGQIVPKGSPTPRGSALVIYSIISGDDLWQTFGPYENTNIPVTVIYRKGSAESTNITYRTSKWHEMGPVTVNGAIAAPEATGNPYEWRLAVGAATSNDITVVASAQVVSSLAETYGVAETSRYRGAIVKWLMRGTDAYGNPWHDPDATTLGLADFAALSGTVVTNMSLTEMYWLDIDPTWNDHDIVFKGGVSTPPSPVIVPGYHGTAALTNVVQSIFMQITNTAAGGAAWAPYILQGADFENNSWVYADPASNWRWTNATFKITGILANGLTSEDNKRNWIPLRWFVFTPGSFGADFKTKIEVDDPYSTASPGWRAGWRDWVEKEGWAPVFYSWDISDRSWPTEAEILKPENLLP